MASVDASLLSLSPHHVIYYAKQLKRLWSHTDLSSSGFLCWVIISISDGCSFHDRVACDRP